MQRSAPWVGILFLISFFGCGDPAQILDTAENESLPEKTLFDSNTPPSKDIIQSLPDGIPDSLVQKIENNLQQEMPCECDFDAYWGKDAPWDRPTPGPHHAPYKCQAAPANQQPRECITLEWCGEPAIIPDYFWSPANNNPITSKIMSREKFLDPFNGRVYCLAIVKHLW